MRKVVKITADEIWVSDQVLNWDTWKDESVINSKSVVLIQKLINLKPLKSRKTSHNQIRR